MRERSAAFRITRTIYIKYSGKVGAATPSFTYNNYGRRQHYLVKYKFEYRILASLLVLRNLLIGACA